MFSQGARCSWCVEEEGGTESFSCDLDLGLQKLWEGHGLEQDFIMNETVDEKETCLMDGEFCVFFFSFVCVPRHSFVVVPDLPQPNEFSKDWQAPRSFRDLVVITNEKRSPSDDEFPPQRFLKTVKGCQSLGLALSWVLVYFQFFPSFSDIVGVADIYSPPFFLDHSQRTNNYLLCQRWSMSLRFSRRDRSSL